MPNVFHPHRSGAAVAVGPLEADILEILRARRDSFPSPTSTPP